MAGVLVTDEQRLAGHTALVSSVTFSPDGHRLFSTGHDRTLRVWELAAGRLERTLHCGRRMSDVAVSPDGSIVGGTATMGQLLLWAAGGWELLSGEVVNSDVEGGSTGIAYSPDGAVPVTGGQELTRHELASGRTARIAAGADLRWAAVASVAFSPDGALLFSAGVETGAITWWDTNCWTAVRTVYSNPTEYDGQTFGSRVWRVAASPDGSVLASAGHDEVVKLRDVRTGAEVGTGVGHDWCLFSVAFSRDGRLLASSGGDQSVRIWDRDRREPLAVLDAVDDGDDGHGAYRVAFSPTDNLLAAACSDRLIRLRSWQALRGPAVPDARRTSSARGDPANRPPKRAVGRRLVKTVANETGGADRPRLLDYYCQPLTR